MSQNIDFQKAREQWIQAALQFLSDKQISLEVDREVTFTENGYQTRGFYKIDRGMTYLTYRNELLKLPEYENVVSLVLNTPSLASILCIEATGQQVSEIEKQRELVERYFSTLLIAYLSNTTPFTFRTADFERLYGQLEHYIFSTEPFDAFWLVHLRNVISEVPSIHLDRDVVLRQATHEERGNAVKSSFIYHHQYAYTEVPNAFVEIHQLIDRIAPPDQQAVSTIAQAVVLALWLIKDHSVGIVSYHWNMPDQPFRLGGGSTIKVTQKVKTPKSRLLRCNLLS